MEGGPGVPANVAQEVGEPSPSRRRYDSPVRRERAAQTQERIVTAAVGMVHSIPGWDWRDLTIRAVARRAGVNESTVYRYFSTERGLHDAVMRRLEEEAGVDMDTLRLDDFADAIARAIDYLSSFPVTVPKPSSPAFAFFDQRRRDALVRAVTEVAVDWSRDEQKVAAAMLDLQWSRLSYEHLITGWNLDSATMTRAVVWVIGLIETAIREGRGPGS